MSHVEQEKFRGGQGPDIKAPTVLRQLAAWLLWRYEMYPGDKKPRKVPYYLSGRKRSGKQGAPEDRARLATFDDALASLQRQFKGASFDEATLPNPGYNGIGCAMLADWGLVGLDFDNCVDGSGVIDPAVLGLIEGTYAELSPSGTGVRAFMAGAITDNKSRAVGLQFGFETFHAAGFLTFTGNLLDGLDLLGCDDYVAPLSAEVVGYCGTRFGAVPLSPAARGSAADFFDMTPQLPRLGWAQEKLHDVLEAIPLPAGAEDWPEPEWVKIGMACHHEASGADWGLLSFDAFSQRGATYPGYDSIATRYARWGRADGVQVTARYLAKLAGLAQAQGRPVLDGKNMMGTAREFTSRTYQGDDGPTLMRAKGLWYEHGGPAYAEKLDESVRSSLWKFLDGAQKHGKDGEVLPYMPTKSNVDGVLDALRAELLIEGAEAPCWLPGCSGPDPRETVSLENGLLHIPESKLYPHSIGFFTLNSLPYGWEPGARCDEWLSFLSDVWQDDPESVETLQEMFGYLLTADTSQQKMFMIVGPKRSGKGTIGRILSALIGRENMVNPTLTSLTSQFGLEPLIDKLVALVPDARIGNASNPQAIVERMLMISGEDRVTVDRKNKSAWSGNMAARFVILTNETPQLGDASGALASRFVTLSMHCSFFGREDLGLTSRLLKELPGIFQWALGGRARLRERGYFRQPESAAAEVEELFDLSSPVLKFTRECCEIDPAGSVEINDLFDAWRTWCGANGRYAGTSATFGRNFKAANPQIVKIRPRAGNTDRKEHYGGVRLNPQYLADSSM